MSVAPPNPKPADSTVEKLFVWLAIYEHGTEGIISRDIVIPDIGTRHVPLMSSKRATAMRMEAHALEAVRVNQAAGQRITLATLGTFTRDRTG